MSTVVRRKVASTPQRSAKKTWEKISELLAPDPKSSARAELTKVAGVAASAISAEAPKDDAIVVYGGGGPRVRVYCLYYEDAVSGDGVEEDPLAKSATEGDWSLSLPVQRADLDWTQKELKQLSSRVTARAVGDAVKEDAGKKATAAADIEIDMQEFMKR